MKESYGHSFLHRYASITAVMTFLLLVAGGLVTSTDSGLAVPDWPLSYGTVFPPMVGGIIFEHTHRVIAAIVGLMIAVLAGWLWRSESRRWVRGLGYSALAAVIIQAILGGLTVLWVLPAPISIAHACLGQTVLCLVVLLALVLSSSWKTWTARTDNALTPSIRTLSIATTAAISTQLVLGSVIRHTSYAVIPHTIGAVVVAAMIAGLAWSLHRAAGRHETRRRMAVGLLIGVVIQLALGAATVWRSDWIIIPTAHVAVGSLLLAGSCVLSWLVCRRQRVSMAPRRPHFGDYLALTKPRLTLLALLATLVGFAMGSAQAWNWLLMSATLIGSALVGAGANALNQWAERDADALMERTRSRPLPARRMSPTHALMFGLVSSGLGLACLAVFVNGLAAWLAAFTWASYLGLYTPLKRKTPLCTLVGAIPGAMPPLIGWAAARGTLSHDAWVLFAILFLWQLPHFLAIAWIHRDEYAQAGFRMLPVIDGDGASTARQMLLYGVALLPTSLLPTMLGLAGPVYFLGALAAGIWFVVMAWRAARSRSALVANRLFVTSIGYLPCVLCLMVADKLSL